MRGFVSTVLALAIAVSSAGCSSLLTSDVPAETVFWLEPYAAPRVPQAGLAPSITVRVTAAPGLDVDRLLVRGPGATLSPYAGARWADRIPEVLSILIRTVLEDSGSFGRVAASAAGARSDWTLDLEARAFYAVATADEAAPTIAVQLRGYLQCDGRDVPIRLTSEVRATENTLTRIVAGFQLAVDQAAMELLRQMRAGCAGGARENVAG